MNIKNILTILFFTGLTPVPSFADEACDDLWFSRNSIFDANGYCFGSTLGKAVFDNSDCTTKSPKLNSADKAMVAEAKEMEARWACNMNTNKTRLDIHSFARRQTLVDQPLRDDTESGCGKYVGADFPLYASQSTNARVVGTVSYGDDFINAHISFSTTQTENWWYVSSISKDGQYLSDIGWTNNPSAWENCTTVAG
jgi:hypothetical protein